MTIHPDFAYVYTRANEMLVKSHLVQNFPFAIHDLIREQTTLKLVSFSQAQLLGLQVEDLGSDSAVLVSIHGKEVLFYNDSHTKARNRFNLAHEFGHYVCEHDLGTESAELYGVYEVEANYFAAQLLMPQQILYSFQQRGIRLTEDFIVEHFGVSGEAARRRLDTLSKTNFRWYSDEEKEFDDAILFRYQQFIQQVCPPSHRDFLYEEEERQRERDTWFR